MTCLPSRADKWAGIDHEFDRYGRLCESDGRKLDDLVGGAERVADIDFGNAGKRRRYRRRRHLRFRLFSGRDVLRSGRFCDVVWFPFRSTRVTMSSLLDFSFENPAAGLPSDVVVVGRGGGLHEEGEIEVSGGGGRPLTR